MRSLPSSSAALPGREVTGRLPTGVISAAREATLDTASRTAASLLIAGRIPWIRGALLPTRTVLIEAPVRTSIAALNSIADRIPWIRGALLPTKIASSEAPRETENPLAGSASEAESAAEALSLSCPAEPAASALSLSRPIPVAEAVSLAFAVAKPHLSLSHSDTAISAALWSPTCLEVQQSEETSSEVVLQTGPSIQGKVINVKLVLYTGFEPQADVKSTEPLHLAFKFLVGKKKNSLLAFGGQVLPEDGDDFEAESTLIAALRRTCSALFNTELPEEGYQKVCEIQYSRPPEKESSTSVIDITHLYVLPAMHIASSKVTVARQPGGVVPKAISLDGLGDYDLSDVMELSFELSLLAEVIIDSLNITFGSRILEFLQSPNVRLLPKKKEETAAKEPKKPKVDADKAEPPKVEGEQQANSSDQLSVPSEVEKKDEALVAEPTAESVDAKAQQAQQLDAEIIQAFRYFDAGNAGYLLGKDIDSLVLSLTDTFTRRTARDLIATLADYRDRLYYRV
eukprot:tig00000863_g4983.t1